MAAHDRSDRSGPLGHVRVLDLTRLYPGAYCTGLLADLGADVVKVEAPGAGDGLRFVEAGPDAVLAAHLSLNRGKRSLRLDLKSPQAPEVLRRLAPSFDVVVESMRPGMLDGLGVGFDALRSDNPRLVWCSITGFGSNGPLADALGAAMEAGLVRDAMITTSGEQARKLWKMREDLAEAQKSAGGSIAHDISVPLSRIPEFIEKADAAVEKAYPGVRHCCFGHVGDGNLHYNPIRPVDWTYERFHAEYPKAEENDAVITHLLENEKRWRRVLGKEPQVGEFLGRQDRWRRLSETWPDPDLGDGGLVIEIATRLTDYITAIEPVRRRRPK